MEKSKLIKILENFNSKTIAVIGDMMIDEYIIGKVERISPEAPVPVVNVKEEKFVLGGAANVVNNIKTLEANVIPYGIIGKDLNGKRLKEELEAQNIKTNGILELEDRPTILKKRILAHNQQLLRLDWENSEAIDSEVENKLLEKIKEDIKNIDAFILSDYDKGILTKNLVFEIIKLANENNKILIVDPKPKNSENYKFATSMTPNTKEALECLAGKSYKTEEEFQKLGLELKEKLNLTNLLITRSEKGMTLFENDKIETIETVAKEVYDVTGAGDTVISVFTLASVAGASFYEAAKIANTAAGVVVGKLGTSTTNKKEIIEFYEEIYENN